MWQDELKKLGVNIHVVATGAGANIQSMLWETPGSSAYLSGASFPYSTEEQEEVLGFMPEHFCSEETSIDLACVAYMKSYKFGGKKSIGIGLTASVASEKIHRGKHRIFATIITDDKILSSYTELEKYAGKSQRLVDNDTCNDVALDLLSDALDLRIQDDDCTFGHEHKDNVSLAKKRFFLRPFFTANGKRLESLSDKNWHIMSGAYNPPHEGHFGVANMVEDDYGGKVVFEITEDPPHKDKLSIQDLLKRAKNLQGYDRLFTNNVPLYIDKARAYPNIPIIMGADAMVRMLDTKWGVDPEACLKEFTKLGTTFYISGREIDGKFISRFDIANSLPYNLQQLFTAITKPVAGHWNFSSTEIRKKL